jgi:hypothetical protein
MGLVRTHRRFGSCLALAALALQIVVSFGHVHLDGLVRAVPAVTAASSHGTAAVQASRQNPAPSPAGDADDYCAICASIYLASTSFVPQAPQLPLPAGFARIEHSVGIAFGLRVEPRRVAFQSRAPPLA